MQTEMPRWGRRMSNEPQNKLLRRVGPGIITAALVLGPGSILSASRVGAEFGYSLIWLLICAAIFMAVFASISARIGCVIEGSLLETIAARFGRWVAVVVGVSGWLVVAGYQFGNNLGVATALNSLIPDVPAWRWPPFFTLVAVAFLFVARDLYRLLEWLMIGLVGVMMVAFIANLFVVGIDGAQVVKGLQPKFRSLQKETIVSAMALVGTTFSIIAAFGQAYFVQEKKWGIADYRVGIRDAWIGIAILGMMTMTIMLCAAGAFGGQGIILKSAGDVAQQLNVTFGPGALHVFCLGLAAASFSSFLANAMLGGLLLSDGLGVGRRVDSLGVKVAASAALVVGTVVAVVVLKLKGSPVGSIIVAQAMTLVLAPLCGIGLLVVANSRSIMGEHRNRLAQNIIAVLGLAVIILMTWLNAEKLIQRFQG